MSAITDLFKKKLKDVSANLLFDEEMKKHTSFKIGGAADYFVDASSVDEIVQLIALCKGNHVPYLVMGNGSNMLVSDKGIRGVVIKIGSRMAGCEVFGTKLIAQSGILLSKLANAALKESLTGIEFAAGIPGTLGGAIYMNAGAYNGEMKDVLESVTYLNEMGNVCVAEKEMLALGYRKSMFTGMNYVILSCVLNLTQGDYETIKAKMTDLNKRRSDKQPLSMPSAGSTFKRPEGYFAGKLIEDAGLKGARIGGAQISTKHSGFVINADHATAKDVLALISYVQESVQKKFGIILEPEVKIIGDI